MNTIVCIVAIFLITVLAAPVRKDVEVIDTWTAAPPLLLMSGSDDLTNFQCLEAEKDVFGGERDLQLELAAGEAGRVLSASVNGNEFNLATPTSTTGAVFIQYDGYDCSSEVNINGLGNADLTSKSGDSFHIVASADHQIEIEIRVYSPDGSIASATITLLELETIVPQEFFVPFSDFIGDVDFKNVGALELRILIEENIDLIINTFAISGKTRVKLVAPTTNNQCDFEKGCCLDTLPEFPVVITSSSTSTSSISAATTNQRDSFDFYDDYFTADSTSSASTQSMLTYFSVVILSVLLFL